GNVVFNTNATFIMSAGKFNIDGNSGTASSSVDQNLNLFDLKGNLNIASNVNGGNITFVDPPLQTPSVSGSGLALLYNGTTNLNWAGNNMTFGDGNSTTTGAANGFEVNTFNAG